MTCIIFLQVFWGLKHVLGKHCFTFFHLLFLLLVKSGIISIQVIVYFVFTSKDLHFLYYRHSG